MSSKLVTALYSASYEAKMFHQPDSMKWEDRVQELASRLDAEIKVQAGTAIATAVASIAKEES